MYDGTLHMNAMLAKADPMDRREGLAAYARYHHVMQVISHKYGVPLERTVAAFVSLSPNSDYIGNLRSTVSVLHGIANGWGIERVQVSTYRHCLARAWAYANGQARFLERTKGPKVRAFYHNVLDPLDGRHVTIDGHMTAIWRNQELTMRQALVHSRKEYDAIANCVKRMAFGEYLVPCELQAILWHTRKRLLNIKYTDQLNIWPHDEPNMLEPYPERTAGRLGPEHIVQPAAAGMQDIRRRQCTDMGSGEPGTLSGMHQASLALEIQ
jgi:hypothetical protein